MPNITLYVPDKLMADYRKWTAEMPEDARVTSKVLQKGMRREINRLKEIKKAKES